MNLQQLEYIIAVDELRHFVRASERCFVTQPTLSMMIHKLEEELGLKIFDRSKQPVEPTPDGVEVIKRARKILGEVAQLKEFVGELKNEISGTIKLAVIPTLAPYLLPLFIEQFMENYPKVNLSIKEMPTNQLITALLESQADIGILATPLDESGLVEHPLFYEEFLAYSSTLEGPASTKNYIIPSEIDPQSLWLLEEGHCFRNQVLNFCELRDKELYKSRLQYQAGSIETLINLVDKNKGVTVVPLLATLNFSEIQKRKLRRFIDPQPTREISLVVNRNFGRVKILDALKKEILKSVPINTSLENKKIIQL